MPAKVWDQIGLNPVGVLLFVCLSLMIRGADVVVGVEIDERGARKNCSVIFSSCAESRRLYLENEGCLLHFAKLTFLDCSSEEPQLLHCLVNTTGTICRLTFFISETYPAALTGKYFLGRKMAVVIGEAASTINVMSRHISDRSRELTLKEESIQQDKPPDSSYIQDQFMKILGGFSLLACAFVCPCWQPKRKRTFKQIENEKELASTSTSLEASSLSEPSPEIVPKGSNSVLVSNMGTKKFTLADIAAMTNNFSAANVIGHGGFGTVYKGKLKGGTLVAVKRGKMGTVKPHILKEFRNEVEILSNISHLNLVKLIGCVEDDQELILVMEYLPNGNLREHLDGKHGRILDLATRLEIAIDVAHALTYLHQYADQPIIHRDVKSTNVLLTERFKAKVADFGFSRIGPIEAEKTHVSTQVKGTGGYLDFEYYQTLHLTPKSDVYSFGVLLIELFSGRRPLEQTRPTDEVVTIRWAADKFVKGNAVKVLDPNLEPAPAATILMERLIDLALCCVAPSSRERPTMQEVTTTLWEIRKLSLKLSSQSS